VNEIHVVALTAIRNGQLLVVRKAGTTRWMQPGGKPLADESLEDALRRELREELRVELKHVEPVGHFVVPAANEPETRLIADVFWGELVGTPHASAEIEELRMVSRDELLTLDRAPLIDACLPVAEPEISVLRPESKLIRALKEFKPSHLHYVRPWPVRESRLMLERWAKIVKLPGEATYANLMQDLIFEAECLRLPPSSRGYHFKPSLFDDFKLERGAWYGVSWVSRGENWLVTGESLPSALARSWMAGEDDVLIFDRRARFLLYLCRDGNAYHRS
jgi:8-oxo-dGTP diphosphatase